MRERTGGKERKSSNQRINEPFKCDNATERATEIMLRTARCELICIVVKHMKQKKKIMKNLKNIYTNDLYT